MECLAGAWSIVPCLWRCSDEHAKYIRHLEDNLASLRCERLKLKDLKEDVSNRVREAEEQQMKRRNQVNGWLRRVEAMENEVEFILETGEQELGNKCLGSCCPKNCRSSYKIGKNVLKTIPRVTKLTEEGQFDVVADELPPPPVDEQPMDNVVVGFESKFEEVWESVQNNDTDVIGLVGMGGVGKTTLLKQLNNEFLDATHGYNLVIWIVVSKPANLEKIRGTIRRKLNIPDHMWENESEDYKNSLIFSKLKRKKFVLLLDDMWEGLNLSEVGIPRPSMDSPGSKIVFTTRSLEVCRSMGADKVIPVGCLPRDESFSLFSSMLGGDILKSHPEMRGLITDVVSECEGLPLALVTIGRAMRGKTDARQWKEAKRTLKKYPSTFQGMEGVFSKLVFSYDSLPNPMVKKCFEYCSLYPEDHNILEEEVIQLWLAEGFIGEYDSMYDALIQGRQIMESLKQACLVETGKNNESVKMHDVIRDMALWIACERGAKKNKFYVEVASGDHDGFTVAPNAMTNAEKIYLQGTGITTESLAGISCCPNLATLVVQNTALKTLPDEISHSANVLKVMHLSGNTNLTWLPIEDGYLTNLEYLTIIGTETIARLPAEVSQWKKLRFLIVDKTLIIPRGVISSLCSLQMFSKVHFGTRGSNDDINSERKSMEREMLSELEGLKHITDIRLTLYSATGIQILLNSPKLQRCTTELGVEGFEQSLPDMLDFATEALTKHLERLQVYGCEMSKIKLGRPSLCNNLREVSFLGCHKIRNLSSLVYAPNLSVLEVRVCDSMSELIGEETRGSNAGTSLFSALTSLTIEFLPKLRSICPQSALSFPSLEVLEVYECESLRKLPLDSNTASTIPQEFVILGEREWWDGLEWDSQATKHVFTAKFMEDRRKC